MDEQVAFHFNLPADFKGGTHQTNVVYLFY